MAKETKTPAAGRKKEQYAVEILQTGSKGRKELLEELLFAQLSRVLTDGTMLL